MAPKLPDAATVESVTNARVGTVGVGNDATMADNCPGNNDDCCAKASCMTAWRSIQSFICWSVFQPERSVAEKDGPLMCT